jgi:hypothetical protein
MRSGRLRDGRRPQAREAGAAGASSAQAGNGNAAPPLHKENLQDAVLADLMRHPGDGQGLVQRVPLNVFTRGTRQDLYRLIALPIVQRKPVDWLITAWQARMREVSGRGAQAAATESLTAIAIRLGAMRTARGTAGVIGRALLGDYEVSMAFGPEWTRQRELNWAAARRPAVGSDQARQEPGVTPGPMPPGQVAAEQQTTQPRPDPAAPRQSNGRHQTAQPAVATGHARGSGQGVEAQRVQSHAQRPAAQRPPWDLPGQLPGPGPAPQR